MKIIFLSIVMVSFFCQDILASGGFIVGNGGDVIRCARGRFAREKLYSLDYMVAHSYMKDSLNVIPYDHYTDSLDNIESAIAQKVPSLLFSFQEFNSLLLNPDSSKKYNWQKMAILDDIGDEGDYRFPGRCKSEYNTAGYVEQAVVRQARKVNGELKVTFLYSTVLISSLKGSYPLQFSFIVVHEWLWNFTKDPEVIRKVNYFLHSKEFQNMPADKVLSQLKRFNFNVPNP